MMNNPDMQAYELMIKANHYLIKGGLLTEKQKQCISKKLLSALNQNGQAASFYKGVNFPGNADREGRRMYPVFFTPPYNNGKKLQTIFGQTPKTQILSANMYELEILRLLSIFAPEIPEVREMTEHTLRRLKTTCFGSRDDGLGECFDASIVVLRFLITAAPDEKGWISDRIQNYNRHCDDKDRPWYAKWYFWLCLSELPFEMAEPELLKYKEEIAQWLTDKTTSMDSERDKDINPVRFCVLRNLLSKIPEYSYIKDRQPYIGERDGRLRFDMTPAMNNAVL